MAVTTLVASLLLTVCRLFAPPQRLLVVATSFVPLALLGYALAALAWWVVRRASADRGQGLATVGVVVALAGLLVHLGWLAPSYVGSHASGRPDLVVMTSNLRLGVGDAATVIRVVQQQRVDVAAFEEVTPQELTALDGLRAALPYVAGQPAPGADGTVVFSRYPLGQPTSLPISKGAWQLRVASPRPFTLIALHTSQPANWTDIWRSDHAVLLAAARRVDGPLVVAGDFNATLDHGPVRRELDAGLSDAARQANAGWQPTWPSDLRAGYSLPWGLGLMALDHVLVSRQLSAQSTSTEVIPGSDHRALIARLRFP